MPSPNELERRRNYERNERERRAISRNDYEQLGVRAPDRFTDVSDLDRLRARTQPQPQAQPEPQAQQVNQPQPFQQPQAQSQQPSASQNQNEPDRNQSQPQAQNNSNQSTGSFNQGSSADFSRNLQASQQGGVSGGQRNAPAQEVNQPQPQAQQVNQPQNQAQPAQAQGLLPGQRMRTNRLGNQVVGNHKPLRTGSNYHNLDTYLNANQGQGEALNNRILSGVNQEFGSAGSQLDSIPNEYRNRINSANALPDPAYIQNTFANPESADPAQFQAYLNQRYSGPTDISQVPDLDRRAQNYLDRTSQLSKDLGSQSGRYSLLDKHFGSSGYSKGARNLDELLLSRGIGSEQLPQMERAGQEARSTYENNIRNINNEIGPRAAQVDQSRNYLRQRLGLGPNNEILEGRQAGALGQQRARVQAELSQQKARDLNEYNDLQNRFKNYQENPNSQASKEDLERLGLDNVPANERNIYDLNLSDPKYFSNPRENIGINHTMTPQQRSSIKALNRLAGVNDPFAEGESQALPSGPQFNKELFQSDLNNRRLEYNTALHADPMGQRIREMLSNMDQGAIARSGRDMMTIPSYRANREDLNRIEQPIKDRYKYGRQLRG